MKRSKFYWGTISGTQSASIAIPDNVRVSLIKVIQTAADFQINFDPPPGTYAYADQSNPDKQIGNSYSFNNLDVYTSFRIDNNHASNSLNYLILGEEDLT